ncbi:MAG: RdgB/HAM1 family non-canonical purine NTP pyrophosphatase [Bacteroidales bacterium]|nr:RdgB/HAM1 family non-canonical purine NTP pyrophosphatase [Bacteroidales bacterium]MDD3384203.1 RdgB/HAM1 family non-canonical purine NTP pyrophosphatase [Bacteroidales bacterium]MDD3812344.1 RdgB/HAM1 family non-canonical purine NTP pyrophosphatase [Bacteroidales bacterium]MDD3871974.1 RdgB/HAM1 family non-canonical purine NTP pyrophosphatase [Bacteroidales bacterium]MDD4813310.1 RdgB/HAM1 family non-canonical purine NTP pyrophosphatase [Bacteroidales bacterium]
MIKRLLFVTNNAHKLTEIRQIAGNQMEILSLADTGFSGEIEETAPDLEGNALQKARFIHNLYGFNCFADDTGLEVDALDGAPGVLSARYAGIKATHADNVNKLLTEMEGKTQRTARFRTVIALILNDTEYLFEGRIEGTISLSTSGDEGFGYDPVFVPQGYTQTFAELPAAEKNRISHRGLAVEKLMQFLHQNEKSQ